MWARDVGDPDSFFPFLSFPEDTTFVLEKVGGSVLLNDLEIFMYYLRHGKNYFLKLYEDLMMGGV